MPPFGSAAYGSLVITTTSTPVVPPSPSPLIIKIAGIDKTALIDWTSISVTQILTKQSDQLSFNIKNYGTKTYHPNEGDEVIFYNNLNKIFAGNIIQITGVTDGLAQTLEIVVKDYSNLLDSQLVSKTYTNTPCSAIISDLLNTFTDGSFTMANVNVLATIPSVVFNYVSISECMKRLVALIPGYDWYVDYNKDIHFFQVGAVLSPFNLTDTSGNFLVNSLQVMSDNSQLANDIIIKGGKVVGSSTRTEYQSGDATRTDFPLGNDFNSIPIVTLDGVVQTVGNDGVDDDTLFQCMWNQGSQLIRFTSGNTPDAGTNNIAITGTPRFPLIYEKITQASISLYGKKQKLINDQTIIDIGTASKRADAELAAYAFPVGTAQFVTYNDGLVVGQYININSTLRGINQNYKIQQLTITPRTPTTLAYTVQLETTNTINMTDILNLLLIQNPASLLPSDPNTTIERVSLFEEALEIDDTIHTPTQSSPPYVYDTAKYNLATWG